MLHFVGFSEAPDVRLQTGLLQIQVVGSTRAAREVCHEREFPLLSEQGVLDLHINV